MKSVKLVYFEGCPNLEPVRKLLRSISEVKVVEIKQDDLPLEHPMRGYSSPTVLLDDQVVYGAKIDSAQGGCSFGFPDVSELRRVLTSEMRRPMSASLFRGFYSERILPRLLEKVMSSKPFSELRKQALSITEGVVLELGFGSGLNLPFYSEKVTRLIATEPSEGALNLARRKPVSKSFPVDFVMMNGEEISLPNASVDQVITTWTLCTIPDASKALREIRRVLKPGGQYLFLEHGRAEDPKVAKWQNRLTPLQKRIGGGCHLNREIDRLIREAGFDFASLRTFYMKGPKVGCFMFQGIATLPTR